MSTSRRRLLGLLVLLVPAGGCTAGGPTVTPPVAATAPTPYTAEQIRDANPPGTRLVFRVERHDGPDIFSVMEFIGGDATHAGHAVMESRTETEDHDPIGDVVRSEATWTELRDHAAFPSARTHRSRASVTVPAGRFDVWLYTVQSEPGQPPTTSRFCFALDRPGPPVLLETEQDGRVISRMVLVEDSRGVTASRPVELTYLAGSLSEQDLAELRVAVPTLTVITGLSRAEALELAPRVHGIDGRYCSGEFLRAAGELRWVQSTSAGVDRYMAVPELIGNDRIVLTNMRAVHGPTIADHAFAMLLSLTRDLSWYLDPANRGTWNRRGSGVEPISLHGRTLLVVGLGGIGTEVARRGKGFGMRVLATRRSDTPPPPYVDEQGRADQLMEFLPEADVVALCLPLTTETEGLIGERELDAFKPGSYLINVGRGRIVDTDALVRALNDGRLAGACLDVTDPEPLPSDHPLWAMPNVVITPHVSGRSALTRQRWHEVYIENLRRFGRGEPLINVVDKLAGY